MGSFHQVPVPPEMAAVYLKMGGRNICLYQRDVEDGHLTVIKSMEPAGWHRSISHRRSVVSARGVHLPGRYPTWDEIKEARYELLPDNCYMAMILPPKSEYVNLHETCFHLYQIPNDVGAGR